MDSACNRNEYQEYFLGGKGCRCVGLMPLPLSCFDCLEIWEPWLSGTIRACTELTLLLLCQTLDTASHWRWLDCSSNWYTWCDNKVRELGISGIVHYEFVPTGQTVNQVYYLQVLKRLREKVRRKRPELFAYNSWILHHDNAPAHTALSVKEFLATKQITVLEHPAYSLDLAPVAFFCSQR